MLVADTEKYLLVQIDSTFCKVKQQAAGARKKYGNQAIGMSRGGKTSKIHALVSENFRLIGLLLTGGNIHDSQCETELLSKENFEGKTVLGDKGLVFVILFKRRRHCLYSRQIKFASVAGV